MQPKLANLLQGFAQEQQEQQEQQALDVSVHILISAIYPFG